MNSLFVHEAVGNPTLYLSTVGKFSVTGVNGANEDVVAFNPTKLGPETAGSFGPSLAFDGSVYGLGPLVIDGLHFGSPASAPVQALAQSATNEGADATQLLLASSAPLRQTRPEVRPKWDLDDVITTLPPRSNDLLMAMQPTDPGKNASIRASEETSSGRGTEAEQSARDADHSTVAARLHAWEHVGALFG